MQRRSFLAIGTGLAVAASGMLLGACTTTSNSASTDKVAKRREINAAVDGSLDKLYGSVSGSRELAARSRGITVFPNAVSAGFIVGGQYGDGALRVGGSTRGYYNIVAGSVGWQIGAQSRPSS